MPSALLDGLRQGKALVRNWHALGWDSEVRILKRRSVDKRGAKSDEAYTRDVLGKMASARNLLVINDEAHHAWRVSPEAASKYKREDLEESTIWVGGLDRLHRSRGILKCYDFSATPFTPSGKKSSEEALVRLTSGDMLVLETKGEDTEQDKVKRRYLDEWVQAVNAHGGFGRWRCAVAKRPGEVRDILMQGGEDKPDTSQ